MTMTHGTPGDTPQQSFQDWWQLQGEWVEAPNQRRGGESGVQRLQMAERICYAKRQIGHTYRTFRHPLGQPTVLRERRALLAFRALGIEVPRLIYCGTERDRQQGWRGLLITEELHGFEDIDTWYRRGGRQAHGEALHTRLLRQIGATLARMHQARWQHGCLYSKHVFVRIQGEQADVALLDLEKSRRRLSRRRASNHDLRQLRRHSQWSDSDWQSLLAGYQQVFAGHSSGKVGRG